MLRVSLAVGCLIAALVSAATAQAQVVSPDFVTQLQPTLPANEQLVGQIRDALPSDNLDLLSQQTVLTVGLGELLQQQLSLALAMASDDAARSRVQGVLAHTSATLDSLRQVQTEATIDSARGRLEQARGEAQEGLDELQPFVVSLPPAPAGTGK
jgi:hypothetical protein